MRVVRAHGAVNVGLWIRNEWELWRFLTLILGLVTLFLIVLWTHELRMRRSARSVRLLEVWENGVKWGGYWPISWPKIVGFWFEDVPMEPTLTKVTVLYRSGRKGRLPRHFLLVLQKQSQVPALISELKRWRPKNYSDFRLEMARSPPPERRVSFVGLSLVLAGYLLLCHGGPLLIFSLQEATGGSSNSRSDVVLPAAEERRIGRFMAAHFSSKAEFKHFIFETGGIMTVAGVALIGTGAITQRRKE